MPPLHYLQNIQSSGWLRSCFRVLKFLLSISLSTNSKDRPFRTFLVRQTKNQRPGTTNLSEASIGFKSDTYTFPYLSADKPLTDSTDLQTCNSSVLPTRNQQPATPNLRLPIGAKSDTYNSP